MLHQRNSKFLIYKRYFFLNTEICIFIRTSGVRCTSRLPPWQTGKVGMYDPIFFSYVTCFVFFKDLSKWHAGLNVLFSLNSAWMKSNEFPQSEIVKIIWYSFLHVRDKLLSCVTRWRYFSSRWLANTATDRYTNTIIAQVSGFSQGFQNMWASQN